MSNITTAVIYVVGAAYLASGTVPATTAPTTEYVVETSEEAVQILNLADSFGNLITIEENEITEQNYVLYFSEQDVIDIAKLLLKECGGVSSKTEQACVAWCVLNRVDKTGDSIYEVLRDPDQFAFYESTEVRSDLYDLAADVLMRWNDEKNGIEDSGRVLPLEYIYIHGDGTHNYFRDAFDGNYSIWDYSLESPYAN